MCVSTKLKHEPLVSAKDKAFDEAVANAWALGKLGKSFLGVWKGHEFFVLCVCIAVVF